MLTTKPAKTIKDWPWPRWSTLTVHPTGDQEPE